MSRRQLYAIVWVLAALHTVRFIGSAPCSDDLRVWFWPAWTFTRASVLSGHLPLWNPYVGCGVSWIGDLQAALFYPLNLLFYLAPFEKVLTLYYFILMGLNGSAAVFMLEALQLPPAAILVGAIGWQASGFFILHEAHLPIAGSLPWFPAWVGCTLRGSSRRWTAAGGLCCGCLLLAGSPQASALLVAAACLWIRPRQLLSTFVLGLALASIQWLPAVINATHASRGGMSSAFSLSFSLALRQLPALVVPELYRISGWPTGSPPDTDYYFGLPLTCLALVGLWRAPRPIVTRCLLLVVIGLLFGLGGSTPVYPAILTVVPGLTLFRAPARFILWAVIGLTVLSAYGAARLNRRSQILVALMLVADLSWLAWPNLRPGSYALHPALKALASDSTLFRVQSDSFQEVNDGEIVRHADPTLYDPTAPRPYIEYLLANELGSIPDPSWYEKANFNSNAVFIGRLDTPMARVLNVRWRLVNGRLQPVPGGQPRFWFVGQAEVVADLDETIRRMQHFDPAAVAYVDRPTPPLQAPRQGSVEVVSYTPDHVTLRTGSDTPALLVSSELLDAGWHATLDGNDAPFYRANGVFRSLYVPVGIHQIDMDYRPPSFAWGASLTILGLVACAVLLR
ncbi:MAG TPA: YfhO family protein [Candidatus Xenobia bacterium]|jgi:hypothetical protein